MTWLLSGGDSGSTLLTVGTETTLVAAETTNGTFEFKADLSPMLLGDIIQFRLYTIVRSGGSLLLSWTYTFGPWVPLIQAPIAMPVPSDQSIKVTAEQFAGTARTIPWSLLHI